MSVILVSNVLMFRNCICSRIFFGIHSLFFPSPILTLKALVNPLRSFLSQALVLLLSHSPDNLLFKFSLPVSILAI